MLLKTICFVLFCGLAGCSGGDKKDQPSGEKRLMITSIRLTDLADQPISLEKYKGKTVFLNFWATWCKPCIEEMASIERAQARLSGRGVVFLLASNESNKQIREFSKGSGYKLEFVRIDNFDEQNIQALPTTYIFDPGGSLRFSEMGSRNWDDTSNINLILNIAK